MLGVTSQFEFEFEKAREYFLLFHIMNYIDVAERELS